jgi:fructuronate reductase
MMNSAPRLTGSEEVHSGVSLPGYERDAHGIGIVHIGLGAFHRAHQAVYTDDALALSGGDWRIQGISLQGTGAADALQPQNGLYTLLVRGVADTQARIVGSLGGVIAAVRDRDAAIAALVRPQTRIVSLTVTEKAYGIDRRSRKVQALHPAISHDLEHFNEPIGAIGMLVKALRQRRADGTAPFTVLCCDNLPDNGHLIRAGVIDFAARLDPDLADWITREVAFPSSMVDRITPAPTAATLADARDKTGFTDLAAVETEPFSQWVIEDNFPGGRPDWGAAGALLVKDVAPYERMKLRMLNGAHSLIAYLGHVAGAAYVRDVMRDEGMASLVNRHLRDASATLAPLPGIDFSAYAQALVERFSNPAIAHETYQIAMDGTEKMPQRIFAPAVECLQQGRSARTFALAVAVWMRYCLGVTDCGTSYALRDPREAEILACIADQRESPQALADALFSLQDFFPEGLRSALLWRAEVVTILSMLLQHGVRAAIAFEMQRKPG